LFLHLILAGAFGNIIDSVFTGYFYGQSGSISYYIFRSTLWNLVSWKVVDMFFPFWQGSFLVVAYLGRKEFTFLMQFSMLLIWQFHGVGILIFFNKSISSTVRFNIIQIKEDLFNFEQVFFLFYFVRCSNV
jgi:signal peptidase II